jgi:hypothetical protein
MAPVESRQTARPMDYLLHLSFLNRFSAKA